MQQQSSSSSSNRFIEHDVCWKTKNSVVECKASENVCGNLLDVLGESETYFLPSGWKLENHQLKFSSRLPLRNIHHIPVRGPRATEFQFFDHRIRKPYVLQLMQGVPGADGSRAPRLSRFLSSAAAAWGACAHARDQNVHQRALAEFENWRLTSAWRIFLRARSTMTLTTKTARHGGVF